jgi:uncharacterized membrane protein
VTREDFTDQPPALAPAKDTVAVYLPMSYQIGGFTIFLPRSQVEPVDMSMEDAMRFTLTDGMSGANAAASETSSTRSAEADSSRAS